MDQQDVYILIMVIKHIVIISLIKLMILSLFSTNLFSFDMVFDYFFRISTPYHLKQFLIAFQANFIIL